VTELLDRPAPTVPVMGEAAEPSVGEEMRRRSTQALQTKLKSRAFRGWVPDPVELGLQALGGYSPHTQAALERLGEVIKLLPEFMVSADVRDYQEGVTDLTRDVSEGNFREAVGSGAQAVGAGVAMVVPGIVGLGKQAKTAARGAADLVDDWIAKQRPVTKKDLRERGIRETGPASLREAEAFQKTLPKATLRDVFGEEVALSRAEFEEMARRGNPQASSSESVYRKRRGGDTDVVAFPNSSALELGLTSRYSLDDIAAFYARREAQVGGDAYERFVRDLDRGGVKVSDPKVSAPDDVVLRTRDAPGARGAATDRTGFTLLRHTPPRGESARVQRLTARLTDAPELRQEIIDIVEEGRVMGGLDWYNTEALRDAFIKELGDEAGDQAWREYIDLVAATSPGSKVPQNIRNASWWYTRAPEERVARVEELKKGEWVPPKGSGYGHKTQRGQAMNVGKVTADEWAPTPQLDPHLATESTALLNPKPRGFAQSLKGGERNIAADLHFTRLLAMLSDDPDFLNLAAPVSTRTLNAIGGNVRDYVTVRKVQGKDVFSLNAKKFVKENPEAFDRVKQHPSVWIEQPGDNEYAAFEALANEIAAELGMTGPQFQASLWLGAAARTGVDPRSHPPFVDIFENILEARAKERGLSKREVFSQFARRQAPLVLPLAAAGGAAAVSEDEKDAPQ
jgi:hypothetical protein